MDRGTTNEWLLAAALMTCACSSASAPKRDLETPDAAPPPGPVGAGPSSSPGTATENPYGATYPTANLGWRARAGQRPGDVLPNVSMRGVEPGLRAIQTVFMSTFFDPEARDHVLVVLVAGEDTNPLAAELFNAVGASPVDGAVLVAIIGALSQPRNGPATEPDLIPFAQNHPKTWTLLDSGYAIFGRAFDPSATPWIGMLDARTMEIVSSAVGGIPRSAIVDAVQRVRSLPAAY